MAPLKSTVPVSHDFELIEAYLAEIERIAEDFNLDGRVDVQDYSLVIVNWGKQCRPMDLNCDGTINVVELNRVILAWDTSE